MKIICLEEHTTDEGISKVTRPVMGAEAGYMADVGSRLKIEPGADEVNRPHLVSGKTAMALAGDLGAGRIAAMDEAGIAMQVISYSDSTQLAPVEQALDLAWAANDRLAEAVRAHSTRFAGFATLPWQVPEAAATELERTVKELGFVGALLIGRPGQSFLDDARYEPVLAKLDELEVPLYVHPGFPLPQVQQPYYGGFDAEVTARLSLFAWGWHNEAGVHVIRMILAGVFDRFAKLRVISGHWGEMVPFYLQRLDDTLPREATGLSRTITQTYKDQVYVTPSGMLYLPHFEFIYRVLGADRILYSVDYPYLTMAGAREFLEQVPVSPEEREKMAHANAESLLKLGTQGRT